MALCSGLAPLINNHFGRRALLRGRLRLHAINATALTVIMHHAERFLHGWPMAARQQSVRLDRCRSLALRHV